MRWVLSSLFVLIACLINNVQAGRLACGVCEALVDEVNQAILDTPKTHSVQTRFRVDEKKRIPYARTEHNLLEIMEADHFPKKFEKYGLVKPWTKTAKHMKRAYELLLEGKEIEPLIPEKKPAAPAATPAATPAEGETAAAATDAEGAAAATPTPEPEPVPHKPYRPTGELPLSLRHNHFHLVRTSSVDSTGLTVETSASITSEIKSTLDEFLEEYLDEAMLMFHRDVPNLKEKLCVEVTEACTPKKKKTKTPTPAAASETKTEAVKDEL